MFVTIILVPFRWSYKFSITSLSIIIYIYINASSLLFAYIVLNFNKIQKLNVCRIFMTVYTPGHPDVLNLNCSGLGNSAKKQKTKVASVDFSIGKIQSFFAWNALYYVVRKWVAQWPAGWKRHSLSRLCSASWNGPVISV